MTDTLDDHSSLPPPPGLYDLGMVEAAMAPASPPDEGGAPPRRPRRRDRRERGASVPPLSRRAKLAQGVLVLIAVLAGAMVLQLVVISSFQQRAAQQSLFDGFRRELAAGTAPIAPTTTEADTEVLLAPGTPIAYLEIPALGLRQVVVEGTASGVLFDGPGHRRDTPFPGQEGTSIILGRRAAFGAPFADISKLQPGDVVRAVTGQGSFDYEVTGVRREGDEVPMPPGPGEGALVLVTAAGPAYFPDGVLRVDAELTSDAVGAPPRPFTASTLPPADQIMASDTSTLYALVLWLQALLAVMVGAVWAWNRWGRAKAWIVFVPPLVLVALLVSSEAAKLLPNLL